MARGFSIVAAGVGWLAAGCASGPSIIDEMQPEAVSIAVGQGRAEFNCPAATGEVLSRERVARTQTLSQPQVSGMMVMAPSVNASRETSEIRAQYTIRVAGCGQRATYTVGCPEVGSGCAVIGARYRQ